MFWRTTIHLLPHILYETRVIAFMIVAMLLVVGFVMTEIIIIRQNSRHVNKPDDRFRILWEKQSYTKILYLLVAFPLGLIYFVLLVPGLVVGICTTLIWLGIPLLIFMRGAWWRVALFERNLALNWLHITLPPLSYPAPASASLWQRLQDQVNNPMTWKTLLYLLLKLPFGSCFFAITLLMLVVSTGVAVASLLIGLITVPFILLVVAMRGTPDIKKRVQRYLLLAATGFGQWIVMLHILSQLAMLAGYLAFTLLGMSQVAVHLEEARLQAEQERIRAEQAEQRRRQLVVNVSHELRAPVTSVAGHLESLLIATNEGTTSPTPAALYHNLSIAHQEVNRLGKLIEELLSLARMEAGELQLDIREVSARDAVEEVYHLLQPLAQKERQVTLVRGYATNLPAVLADYQRLIQIILNLVRNAITYTPTGGIVSITLGQAVDARHLVLLVEDNGIGIPSEELQHIFERFYRVDASRTRATGGFGLGLAIVHDLVTAMGGTITVESTKGQGSRFCVLLRCALPVEPVLSACVSSSLC